jgi:hypothetical protein
VYDQPNHKYARTWITLFDPEDVGKGVQGFLRVNMVVLGPNDEDVPDKGGSDAETDDDIAKKALGSPQASADPLDMTIKVFKAEDMPPVDSSGLFYADGKDLCDPYVLSPSPFSLSFLSLFSLFISLFSLLRLPSSTNLAASTAGTCSSTLRERRRRRR